MNYRHAYHAGNFADVLKHAVLARVLTYLKLKPQPFRVIDTHAGAGRYDLEGEQAGKTGEWRDGIGRILAAALPQPAAELLAPYFDAIRSCNTPGALRFYPGSPLIAHMLMRQGDALIANELHPGDAELLSAEFHRAKNAKVLALDGWQAVRALLPPKERRGLILIDPPFEAPDEFGRLGTALADGLSRFATGTYLIWYPVKQKAEADAFLDGAIRAFPALKFLEARLAISDPFPGLGLTETGILVVNPPYTLKPELETLLPVLTGLLADGPGAGWRLRHADGS